jgi:hypothetical protein
MDLLSFNTAYKSLIRKFEQNNEKINNIVLLSIYIQIHLKFIFNIFIIIFNNSFNLINRIILKNQSHHHHHYLYLLFWKGVIHI